MAHEQLGNGFKAWRAPGEGTHVVEMLQKIAFGYLTGSFKRGQQKQPFHAGPHKLPETKNEVRHGETPFS